MFQDEFRHLYISLPWVLLAVGVFVALFFVTAPYGRHATRNWGLSINNSWAWLLMEAPAPLVFAACYLVGSPILTTVQLVFFGMWQLHYVDRAFIYPFVARKSRKTFPGVLVASGFVFNLVNTYLNGSYIVNHNYFYPSSWFRDGRFLIGVTLFIIGFVINRHADYILRGIRNSSTSDYAIPKHGLYRWISCPNYFGEILLWLGWATATWSPAAAAFALWTIANLAPRAYAHHKWYHEHFAEYPQERRALLPGIW
jgi:3-oxo-5-alpha-steroid 4-dehydrogenase 1